MAKIDISIWYDCGVGTLRKKYKGSPLYAFFVPGQTFEQVKLLHKVNHWISHKDTPKFTSRIFEIDVVLGTYSPTLCGIFIAHVKWIVQVIQGSPVLESSFPYTTVNMAPLYYLWFYTLQVLLWTRINSIW